MIANLLIFGSGIATGIIVLGAAFAARAGRHLPKP